MDLEHLDKWAKIKGISILGTGDFTHPGWLSELKEKLELTENGFFKLKNSDTGVRFILTGEISCIYSKAGRTRKIHLVIFAPSFEVVDKINTQLSWIGNLKSDGRPILGLDAKELLKIVLDTSEKCLVVPAHIWTPHFSIFGANSGFDSVEECFEELSSNIYALETGLSSDPEMNWRLKALDKYTLISNSDAHNPKNLGREANVFEGDELSYRSIIEAIKLGSKAYSSEAVRLIYTIEFFPQEGKYHFDGHRSCGVRLSPSQTKKANYLCPKCKKPLTIGVMHRVEKLADRPEGFKPQGAIPQKHLIPLAEIIASALGQQKNTKAVDEEYQNLVQRIGSEFEILLEIPLSKLQSSLHPKIFEGIKRVREEKIKVLPGYDGEYGKVQIFKKGEEEIGQAKLF
jgi:uncharacterized protein (TIGR00375 family)